MVVGIRGNRVTLQRQGYSETRLAGYMCVLVHVCWNFHRPKSEDESVGKHEDCTRIRRPARSQAWAMRGRGVGEAWERH